jgi:glycosyltransferase involved in cell wall biosynthesis
MRKKKVLFIGEASCLGTGFSTYWNEVLKRLYDMDKFDIAELGSYISTDDERIKSIPWKFYPVIPSSKDLAGQEKYRAGGALAQFGASAFEDVCLDFKPDIVIGIRDFWMDDYINFSPYRKYFKFLWMLTIDGIPQRDLWLDSYRRCDGCLTYSNWAMDVMNENKFDGTNMITIASPGADIETFKPPENKKQHKIKMGIDPNTNIIGMVSRNQKRKLFYDLIEAFSQWIYKAKSRGQLDLINKTFLWLHTSYPDVGYDIGRAISEFKVGNKVLMTYMCNNCGAVYPSFFHGELTNCRRCKQKSAHAPNANSHVPREVLANIMKCFDLGVQYTISEGWSMTVTEQNACGVPVMATDYSAIKDHLKNPGNISINVGRYFYESIIETEQRRALPDNNDFINKLDSFLKFNEEKRNEISKKVRQYIIEETDVYGQKEKLPRYSWDRTAAIWKNVIEQCEIYDNEKTWLNKEYNIIDLKNISVPENLDNAEFINWVIKNIYKRQDLVNSFFAIEWMNWLNMGSIIQGGQRNRLDRRGVITHFTELANKFNKAEIKRTCFLQKQENPNILEIGIF